MSDEKPLPDNFIKEAERIRRRLPDYFKVLEEPWHFACSMLKEFVDDEEQTVTESGHVRNLFHVAKALWIEAQSRTPAPAREDLARALETSNSWERQRKRARDLALSVADRKTVSGTLKRNPEFGYFQVIEEAIAIREHSMLVALGSIKNVKAAFYYAKTSYSVALNDLLVKAESALLSLLLPKASSEPDDNDKVDDEKTVIRWQERIHAITDEVGVDGDGSDGDELDYTATAVQKAINKLRDEITDLEALCCGDDDHANCPELKAKLAELKASPPSKSEAEIRAEAFISKTLEHLDNGHDTDETNVCRRGCAGCGRERELRSMAKALRAGKREEGT